MEMEKFIVRARDVAIESLAKEIPIYCISSTTQKNQKQTNNMQNEITTNMT